MSDAFIVSPITIDGDMSDWDSVLANAANNQHDTQYPADGDNASLQSNTDRDIYNTATTYDSQNLYLYWRRSAAGQRSLTFYAYIDRDGDGRLETNDRVCFFGFTNDKTGATFSTNANQSNISTYAPADPVNGDFLGGDGFTEPGAATAGTRQVPGAVFSGAANSSGLVFETSVSWASLGVPAGSPIRIHFSSGSGNIVPTHVMDNVGDPGAFSLTRYGSTLTPNRIGGAEPNESVTYVHALVNSGNATETFTLTPTGERAWATALTINGIDTSTVALAPGTTATVAATVFVPSGATPGTFERTTITATSLHTDPVSVTDTTYAGRLSLYADSAGSVTPSGTIVYPHTLSNVSNATMTVDVSVVSGWPATILDANGVATSTVTLAPGTSTGVSLRTSAPATATIGTQATAQITARIQGESVRVQVLDTTTVRAPITISSDQTGFGGAGSAVSYLHTITNSTSTTANVTLSASPSSGWQYRFYSADGVTRITSVTVPPFGGSVQVQYRIYIPVTAVAPQTDTSVITASIGSYSDTDSDVTIVRALVTYDGPGYQTASTRYTPGDTVYSRAMGINATTVRFRWVNPAGATVYETGKLSVDTDKMAFSQYSLPPTATVGMWTLILLDDRDGTEIARTTFDVVYDAEITALSANDAATFGDDVDITASVKNNGTQAIAGSSMTYVVWWDTDGNGSFGEGDLYVDQSGVTRSYSSTTTAITHLTTGIAVNPGATWNDSLWSLSGGGFPNQGTYKVTAVWTGATGVIIDTATTTFFAVPALGWPLFLITAACMTLLLAKRLSGRRPSQGVLA